MATFAAPKESPSALHIPSRQARGAHEAHVNAATRRTIAVVGAVAALAGIEHGIGEILQGNVAPAGVVIESWPRSAAFRVLAGEPAFTLVPNLLATGILAIVASVAFLVWVTTSIQRRHGGLVLILLSLVMFLVGSGFGPPLIGAILGSAAPRIGAPLNWWRTHLSGGARHFLAALWPWLLGVDVLAWLGLFPGVVLVGFVFGGDAVPEVAVYALTLSAFGFLLLALGAAFAYDSQKALWSTGREADQPAAQ